MSSKSNDFGRAFEYACVIKLDEEISHYRPVSVDEESIEAAKRAWNTIDKEQQETFIMAASAFINTLFDVEPLILESDNDVVKLSINKDSDAEVGDVRDIVITRGAIQWQIGLSMKHNHLAAKHSRLSAKIDFGEKWYGIPCDASYWNAIRPIFINLVSMKKQNIAWNEMSNKEYDVYVPLLNAFMSELLRAYTQDPTLTKRLLSYLLGTCDFYKVVAIDSKRITEFQAFNLRGELNKDGKYTKAKVFIPVAELPDEIISMRMKPNSTNTIELYLNKGWSLSFRIHNASTIVEPSLKFDIQFIGVPSNIITINCLWK
jgi:hypothetical protein